MDIEIGPTITFVVGVVTGIIGLLTGAKSSGKEMGKYREKVNALEKDNDELKAEMNRRFDIIVQRLDEINRTLGPTVLRTEVTWAFLMRRANVEVVREGFGSLNSPLIISEMALAIVPPALLQDMCRYYIESSLSILGKEEMLVSLEYRFGSRILKEMCIPHKMLGGACLLIARAAIRKALNESSEEHLD